MIGEGSPKFYSSLEAVTNAIFAVSGQSLRLATPLGLGKPNRLLNSIYHKAQADSRIELTIYTALSLGIPEPSSELARRFYDPFEDRHWGRDYPILEYARDAVRGRLPANIRVREFYLQAGAYLKSPGMQQDYQSINYTHVAEAIFAAEVQVIVQLIAKREVGGRARYSLSCSPDLTLDVYDLYREEKRPLFIVGVIHPDLPFLQGDAEVPEEFFDILLEDSESEPRLYALPRLPITETDHAIGFYASQLVVDDGTLQIGIGSLSDALVSALLLRHQQSPVYRSLCEVAWKQHPRPAGLELAHQPFEQGLYGLSEMVMDGFMHLRRAGILRRQVIDERSGKGTYLHGAFFLGSREFYDWLGQLEGEDFEGLRMTRVSKVNDLYDPHELRLRRQRKNPRFFNTCMQVTLLGGAASDTLEDGRVVSGVGGQFNFVAMAHELKRSRSILMLRSTRGRGAKRQSNLVWSHGQLTIPRHLRDIVITEYGIADLRGKTDQETIESLLAVADADFQVELAETAKRNGKLSSSFRISETMKRNRPETVNELIAVGKNQGTFAPFALGSDFTPEEERLLFALERLSAQKETPGLAAKLALGRYLLRGGSETGFAPELARLGLSSPRNWKEKGLRRLVLGALAET